MGVDFRYAKAGYVALNVTDLDQTAAFITDIVGLTPSGIGPDGERFFRCGVQHHDVVIYQDAEPGLVRHAWEMESEDDVQKAWRRLEGLGLKPRWLSKEERQVLGIDISEAFRVREPTAGICYEFYSDILKLSTPLTVNFTEFECFLHTGINCPDVKATTQWHEENMGYVVSDYLGVYVGTLVRAWPIPHHHTIGFLPTVNGKPGLNHIAFKVKTIDDIGRYYHRGLNNGQKIGLGIGRHPTSGSYHA